MVILDYQSQKSQPLNQSLAIGDHGYLCDCNRSYLCILDIRWSSMSSLPRKPLANGLFSILSWVICKTDRTFVISDSTVNQPTILCKKKTLHPNVIHISFFLYSVRRTCCVLQSLFKDIFTQNQLLHPPMWNIIKYQDGFRMKHWPQVHTHTLVSSCMTILTFQISTQKERNLTKALA